MRILKNILKWSAIVIGAIVLIAVVVGLFAHESKPTGSNHQRADSLANYMLKAVDKAAWDSTGAIQWDFAGVHQILWDKERHLARVVWGKKRSIAQCAGNHRISI